ncbi:hypothetical protein M9H77_12491 [Catharanthus roseus]|uniref:Uncharacterized protein n=1 Tax=Catharanthus roseus TaxID=4058 RepID=A0ACC0BHK8_CATRO|nr:hypothetical protein M9H77_12491 [Catharanthus roseus]
MPHTRWTLTNAEDLGLAFIGGGINGQELFDVYLMGSSLFTDKSGNIVSSKLWPLAKDVRSFGSLLRVLRRLPICIGTWIYMYFPMFAPVLRPGTQSCKLYIQQFPMLGHKTEHKLLDIRLRLDMMSTDKARRPENNKMYVVRNFFMEALWLEAPSHLLTETWTSVPAIPPSTCTEDYMDRFLPRTQPRIQNPINVPASAIMDMIAREVHQDDAGKEEKYDRIADLVNWHYRSGS